MIAIRAWGLAGHLGPTARTFVTAARAGQLAPRAPVGAARGSPLGGGRARWLDEALDPASRAHQLAVQALHPTLLRGTRAPVTLVVAWPDELGGQPTRDVPDHRVMRAIVDALGARLDPASILIRGGRTGFARAMETATELLEAGANEVVVGAVDSPIDLAGLSRLEREGRLAGPNRPEGCIPGEAAAFLRLGRAGRSRWGAAVGGVAHRAPGRSISGGTVLSRVAGLLRPDVLLPDVNGERARTADWLAATSEARDELGPCASTDWSATIGDARDATGAVLAVVALESAEMTAASARSALVSLVGDDGARGAIGIVLPRAGAFRATTAPAVRSIGVPRRAARGIHAAAIARSLADIVEEVAGLLVLGGDQAGERLAAQLDALLALVRPGGRAPSLADLHDRLAAFGHRTPPVARAARWLAAHLERRRMRAPAPTSAT